VLNITQESTDKPIGGGVRPPAVAKARALLVVVKEATAKPASGAGDDGLARAVAEEAMSARGDSRALRRQGGDG